MTQRDLTVAADFRIVPRVPDVAAYPPVAEHVWVPQPRDAEWMVVRVVTHPAPRPVPNYQRIKPATPSASSSSPASASAAPAPGSPAQASPPAAALEVRVRFAFDRFTLDGEAKSALDRFLAEARATAPNAVFEVDAYTDGKGSESYNLTLSRRRADAVRSYLVSSGVPQAAVAVSGHGRADPVADNASESGRAANRRATVRATPKSSN